MWGQDVLLTEHNKTGSLVDKGVGGSTLLFDAPKLHKTSRVAHYNCGLKCLGRAYCGQGQCRVAWSYAWAGAGSGYATARNCVH